MTYTPDDWAILRITSEEFGVVDKIFCSWSGGYAGSDQWKLSSGIVKYTQYQDYIEFLQDSGSVYRCYTNAERLSGYMSQMLHSFRTKLTKGKFDVVSFSDYKSKNNLNIPKLHDIIQA